MGAYTLTVLNKGDAAPVEIAFADRAPEVLALIETLLAKHPDCYRIRVSSSTAALFSVDCTGERVSD